ncbi:mercuric reductase [Methylobacterium sp. Leaf86]|uniref:dihydrolipoyl dehydrogenase family protein n=1 Tax=Methylobacterium sp. Leaf86 TaxID=1736242 RepID=UPI0006F82561|nr:FAD-dependent oxidoreductase [Methylobacterium sp. Leaf86]KQO58061.1 mercuric reductase [Methylobacterium sp. Leaf86]
MSWTHDVVVVGAGAAGLTAAGGLAQLGLRVALVEAGPMGGECLNTGCVPSKALLAIAARAQAVREAGRFGILAQEPQVNFVAVMAHVRGVIAEIAPHDAPERFEAWGVEVIRAHARFTAPRTLLVAGRTLRAPRIVLAVGSRPTVPSIPGLDVVPFLTNETLFSIDALPDRLVVLGAGSVGMEMAQAFRRLGGEVAVIDRGPPLSRDEPEAAGLVAEQLQAEGVTFHRATIRGVSAIRGGVSVELDGDGTVEGSHLLVALGRSANLRGLSLDEAGVGTDGGGIVVDDRLRTSARGVYAIGDCRDGPRLTHAAGYEGARIVAAIGFGLRARVDYRALPRVAYTSPELAQVGMTEAEAREKGGRVTVMREPFADNDRAVAEGASEGFLKLVRRNGRVVGACLVGERVGDLTMPWVLSIGGAKPTPWALSGMILPYPTRSEITKAAAFVLYAPRLFSWPARLWAGILAALRRRLG